MKINWKIIIIVILALTLRVYKLGDVPPSLDWDEASLAYNARTLLETGRDEYGNSWPITIRSFNDYKPSLYTYSLIPTFILLGESNFAVRFPSALAGTLAVLLTYFLVKQLFSFKKIQSSELIALLSALLLTISPWHLQFSRVAFEANLALLFFIAGILALLKSRSNSWWLPISALTFGLSLTAYHSTKILIPPLIILISLPHIKTWLNNKKTVVIAGLITAIFVILIGRTMQLGIAQSRFKEVSFMTIDNLLDNSRHRIEAENLSLFSRLINHRYLVYGKEIIGGYTDHYNIKFWFVEGDGIARHNAVGMGFLYWWTLPFLIIGMIYLINQTIPARKIIFSWFLIAPIASSLTSGTPNSVRAIFFLPTFDIFIALGIITSVNWLKNQKQLFFSLLTIGYVMLTIINIVTYFHLYYIHTPLETSQAWQYGYKEVAQWVMSQKDKYDRIIITNSYDQPYIYMLWYGKYSPKTWVNDGEFAKRFDKFEFRIINWEEDRKFTNTLLIGSPDEIKDKTKAIWSVNFLDGTPAFLGADTKQSH